MPEISSQTMVEQIEEAVEDEEMELSEWETEFIENIKRRIASDEDLTPKQDEALLRIWRRARGD